MNTRDLEQKLREEERELLSDLTRFEREARVAGDREIRDSSDDATASQGTSEAFEEGTIVSQTLEQVQDALHRIENGTYGTCIVCGRSIEPARLEALPGRRSAWKTKKTRMLADQSTRARHFNT